MQKSKRTFLFDYFLPIISLKYELSLKKFSSSSFFFYKYFVSTFVRMFMYYTYCTLSVNQLYLLLLLLVL